MPVEALEEAFAKYGQPEIVNTDQGQPVHRDRFYRRGSGARHQTIEGKRAGATTCSSNGFGEASSMRRCT